MLNNLILFLWQSLDVFLTKTKVKEKILKCNKWHLTNLGQNATNPIWLLFCNLRKGNQVSQVGTNFLVLAPTFRSHCQQIIYLKSIETKTKILFYCFGPYTGNLWSKL